jgi:hypothetical protein
MESKIKCFNLEDFEDQKIAQLLKCNISGGVLNDPIMVNCGHSFCRSCAEEYFEVNTQCPTCKTEMDKDQFKDSTPSLEILQTLKMTCPLQESGCSHSDLYKSMLSHYSTCEYKVKSCKQCDFKGTEEELTAHIPTCPKREISCMFCFNKICFDELKEHSENCDCVEVQCPEGCGDKVKKKNLALHAQLYCEKSVSKCCYESIGCLFEGNKEELIEHCNDPFAIILHEKLKTVRENENHKEMISRFDELSTKLDTQIHKNPKDKYYNPLEPEKQLKSFKKLGIPPPPPLKRNIPMKASSGNRLINQTTKKMQECLRLNSNQINLANSKNLNPSFFSSFHKGDNIKVKNRGNTVVGGDKCELVIAKEPAQSMKTYTFQIDASSSWVCLGMVNIEKVKALNYNLRHGYSDNGCYFLYNNGFHLIDSRANSFYPNPTFAYKRGDIIDITWNSQRNFIEFRNKTSNLMTKIYLDSTATNLHPAVHCLSNKCQVTYLG